MAIGTIIFVSSLVIGACGMAYDAYKTEEENRAAKKQALKDRNEQISEFKTDLQTLKSSIEIVINDIKSGRDKFKSGGYVVDGLALNVKGDSLITMTLNNLDDEIVKINNAITKIEKEISNNKSEISKL